jgi:putative ABC transport system ATP-binding protein
VEPVLTASGVVKSFGGNPALRGIDLELRAGEVVAVTGPSGSGKSTLLHCLAGIEVPDSGTVEFDGRRIDDRSEGYRSTLRRSRFGVLFQFGHLVAELTAAENVAMPLLLGGARRRPALATANAWLERFELDGLGDRRPGELSGGQAQRVAAARALVTEPAVLFADEPTGALDSLAGEHVMTQVTRLVRDVGTSVVLVTHDARISAYADREVLVRDGLVDGVGAR